MEISICITTYNHQEYIEKSLLSVLNQVFYHEFEIIITNDNSKDDTEKIILEIQKNHPKGSKIKYYYQNPNLGYVPNLLFSFQQAKGKYIAILDGDDDWTDEKKLQKQYDFLEKHKDFSAVGSDSLVIYNNSAKTHTFSHHLDRELSLENLTDTKICQTSTFFFRKEILKEDFPSNILSADRCLYLLAGCFGKIKILPEITSTYRKFDESLSRKVTDTDLKQDFRIIPFIRKYTSDISVLQLNAYFYYTLISYSNFISKKSFFIGSIGYFINNMGYKFKNNPQKIYHDFKWTLHTIKQKYQLKKQNNQFT